MTRDAHELLLTSIKQSRSALCVGLDPDLRALDAWSGGTCSTLTDIADFLAVAIDASAPFACAFKIQKAFFDEHPEGQRLLAIAVSRIRAAAPLLPVYLDGKFGDIDNTMRAYLSLAFDRLGVDGVVVNPYMGTDVFESFSKRAGKAALTLVRTSNVGADCIQELPVPDSAHPLWIRVLALCLGQWSGIAQIIPILSSNATTEWPRARALIPQSTPIFIAGFGAQGGKASALSLIADATGGGVCVNASRRVLFPSGHAWADRSHAIRQAASDSRDELYRALKA